MSKNIRKLLPIGSVVLLKEATKKVMVFGIMQSDPETEIEYDYLGVLYPEGNMGEGTQFFFNHDALAEIVFRGYEDEERTDFIDRLQEYYNEI